VLVTTQPDDLFGGAVAAWLTEPFDGSAVDDLLVVIVGTDPGAAVDLARRHLRAKDAGVRGTAAQLLAVAVQLGDEGVRRCAADLAITAYAGEDDPGVLVGLVRTLGSARSERGLPILTALAEHSDAGVRSQVACGLPSVVGDPPDASGVAALIALSSDADPEVRDWATFGLGTQTDADSDAIRDALWARVADPYVEARDEAVVALGRRRDPRVIPVVAELLAEPDVGALVIEAATHLADPCLLPQLRRVEPTGADVRSAIEACERRLGKRA
jgi:HEAT repeat protein